MTEDVAVQDAGTAPTAPAAEALDLGYTIATEHFSGPLDLLLFLVRRTEVDIVDIPLVTVIDQFVATVSAWQDMDLEVAGDFIAMAATLLEIKARMVAPPPENPDEIHEEEDLFDPRSDLINALLAYRRFKEAAIELTALEAAAAGRSPRIYREAIPDDPDDTPELELGSIDAHLLMRTCETILARINGLGPRTVPIDDVPLTVRINQLIEEMRERRRVTMRSLLVRESATAARLGTVLATLECTRQRFLELNQLEQYGDVDLRWRDDEERSRAAELPPEEPQPAGKRRRRPPLVTWTPPVRTQDAQPESEEAEAPEEPLETDEQRFLRELDEQCGLGVLDKTQDVEKSFLAHWFELHPELKPPEPPAPEPPPPAPPVAEAPAAAPRKPRVKSVAKDEAAVPAAETAGNPEPANVATESPTAATVPEQGSASLVVEREDLKNEGLLLPGSAGVPPAAEAAAETAAIPGGQNPSESGAIPPQTTTSPDLAVMTTTEATAVVVESEAKAEKAGEKAENTSEPDVTAATIPSVEVAPVAAEVVVADAEKSALVSASSPVVAEPVIETAPAVMEAVAAENVADTAAPAIAEPASAAGPAIDNETTASAPVIQDAPVLVTSEVSAVAEPVLAEPEPIAVTASDPVVPAPEAALPVAQVAEVAPVAEATVVEAPADPAPLETATTSAPAEAPRQENNAPEVSEKEEAQEVEEQKEAEKPVEVDERIKEETEEKTADEDEEEEEVPLSVSHASDEDEIAELRSAPQSEVDEVNAALLAADDQPPPRFIEQAPADIDVHGLKPDDYLAEPVETAARVEAQESTSVSTIAQEALPALSIIQAPPAVTTTQADTDSVLPSAAAPDLVHAPLTVPVVPSMTKEECAAKNVLPEQVTDSQVDMDPPLVATTTPELDQAPITVPMAPSMTAEECAAGNALPEQVTDSQADIDPPLVATTAPVIDHEPLMVSVVPSLTVDEPTVPDHQTPTPVIPPSPAAAPPSDPDPEPPPPEPVAVIPSTPPAPATTTEPDPDDVTYLQKFRLWRIAAILIAGLLLIGLTLVIIFWLPRSVLEVTVGPSTDQTLTGRAALTWRFNLDVQPEHGAAARTPEPLITPPTAGVWTWSDRRTLVFTPAADWTPATTFQVRLAKGQLASADGFVLGADLATTVHSPALAVESGRVDTFAADGSSTVAIAFNQKVDAARFVKALRIEQDGKTLPVTPITSDASRILRLRVTGTGTATATLDAGFTGVVGDRGLADAWSTTLVLGPSLRATAAHGMAPSQGPLSLWVDGNGEDLALLAEAITIEPPVSVRRSLHDGMVELSGDFAPGATYRVRIAARWPEETPSHPLTAYPMAGELTVTMPHRQPGVWMDTTATLPSAFTVHAMNTSALNLTVQEDERVVASHALALPEPPAIDQARSLVVDVQERLADLPAGSYRLRISDTGDAKASATISVDKLVVPPDRILAALKEWQDARPLARTGTWTPRLCVVAPVR